MAPHKVWILDCRSCNSFLTNRGMRAVLLLRPSVALYSSDALPANCSACSASPRPHRAPRTCDCLTQTLCCHGCGNAVGYMIVVPCARCTTSITTNNRATNGHRFVFHSSEVTGTERYYIKDEPGVVPYDPPLVESPLATPPLEFAHRSLSPEPEYTTTYYRSRSPRTLSADFPEAPDRKDTLPIPPSLKPGDVILWHHLARTGEIPGVADDERARDPHLARMSGLSPKSLFFDR